MMFRSYYNPTTLHDLLMNTLLGFVLLFTVAILLINPDSGKKIDTKAEFVIAVTWPDDSVADVDTWLEDPEGAIAHFRQKDIHLMHLDRDDLGKSNDVVWVGGHKIVYPFNQELTSIRGFVPGEWVLNVHLYNKKEHKGPIKVSIRIDKLNPNTATIFTKTVILNNTGEEITVTRFTMTADGDIVDWDDLPKNLIQTASAPQFTGQGSPGP